MSMCSPAPSDPHSWASSVAARRRMLANRRIDTAPEVALRRALHACGLRFRKDHRLDLPGRRVRPDIAFTRAKLAVFVDGCFWHRCPLHASFPRANAAYWASKLEATVERDGRTNAALIAAGWRVLRVWEHEPIGTAVVRIVAALDDRQRSVEPGST